MFDITNLGNDDNSDNSNDDANDNGNNGYHGGGKKHTQADLPKTDVPKIDVKSDVKSNFKDDVTKTLIPNNISECSLMAVMASATNMTGTCMSEKMAHTVYSLTNTHDMPSAKAALRCETERCVLGKLERDIEHELNEPNVPNQLNDTRGIVRKEISLRLKIVGPTDNKLLNNVDIDTSMQQWAAYRREFYPYNFHMLNYASYSYRHGRVYNTPDTLATIPFDALYQGKLGQKYTCAGCIINTDTYQGDGVHWMALFVDSRTNPATAEFFNSSGNAPAPEWVNWMEKTKNIMLALGLNATSVRASTIRHQKSRTECGLYSLFYVWARLHNIPVGYFAKNRIPDQLMFEFRQHLFDDPLRPAMKKFDWDEYVATTKLTWE